MSGSIEDLTGQRFGQWTAREFRERRNKETYWLCECDCGAEQVVQAGHLKSGHSKSCGHDGKRFRAGRVISFEAPGQSDQAQSVYLNEIAPHREKLLGQAYQMTKNPIDAEDLVQDVMLKAWSGINTYKPGTNALGWLFRIMTNSHIDAVRKKEVRDRTVKELSLGFGDSFDDDDGDSRAVDRLSQEISAEEAHLEDQISPELLEAVNQLPEQFRQALYLHVVKDLSIPQIADLLGIPKGTVLSRVHRGKHQLRDLLSGYELVA